MKVPLKVIVVGNTPDVFCMPLTTLKLLVYIKADVVHEGAN